MLHKPQSLCTMNNTNLSLKQQTDMWMGLQEVLEYSTLVVNTICYFPTPTQSSDLGEKCSAVLNSKSDAILILCTPPPPTFLVSYFQSPKPLNIISSLYPCCCCCSSDWESRLVVSSCTLCLSTCQGLPIIS